ncbi:unnamed protein product, partial [Closterium sp. NIES-54]
AGGSATGGTRAGSAGATSLEVVGAASPGGARTRGTRAAGAGGVGGAGAGGAGAGGTGAGGTGAGGAEGGDTGIGGAEAGDTGAGGTRTCTGGGGARGAGAGDPRARGAGAVDLGAGVACAGDAASGGTGAGGIVQRRPFFVPPPPSSLPPPDSVLCQNLKRREPGSRPALPVRAIRTGRRVPRPRPPLSPALTFWHFVLPLFHFEFLFRLLLCPLFLSFLTLTGPPSVKGECALSTDILEDRQEDFEFLAAAVPRFASMLLAPKEDPDAPDIPTPRSYTEAITGPYSSQWQIAMDAEMASWKSTGTYVDAAPPSRANIVDGMWIFRVKQPPGCPLVFKPRYVE